MEIKPPAPDAIYEPPIKGYDLVNYHGDNQAPMDFEIPFYFSNIGLKSLPGTPEFTKAIQEYYLEYFMDTHDPGQIAELPAKNRYLYYIPFGEDSDNQTDFEDMMSGMPENNDEQWLITRKGFEYLINKLFEAKEIIAMTKETMLSLGAKSSSGLRLDIQPIRKID